ncbi:glycoside hydrolase family 1 protein [Phenylobacterium aquaticum]|uniref:glycoside hydrolase family 1 protein n=1 Tax=Phenylobacterium aquaticum TaxID=1763816 RepID=UPI001F5D1708|nr:family 1 glycosylhydrolase [Phenylobacterium aquaticum]MCI3131653.1 family 1 glycosylhydrolase [Phenylobacterium aquaticum]
MNRPWGGFLWGAATAAHQVEGGNVSSDIWLLENLPDRSGGFREPSGDAVDHYHRYAQDLDLLAGLGLNAYRFSVEWARIEPEAGRISQAALDHYARMADACLARGLTPLVTLHHFTSPLWLAQRGGWDNPEAADRFADHCARVAAHLADRIGAWVTFNEINLASLAFELAPERRARRLEKLRAAAAARIEASRFSTFLTHGGEAPAVLTRAHALAAQAVRAASDAPVGLTLALPVLQAEPGGEGPRDRVRAETQDRWLDITSGDDFVGVQTYTRELFGPQGRLPPPDGEALTLTGWEVYPQALGRSVAYAAQRTGKPILVTENGIATAHDPQRRDYTQAALEGLAAARAGGAEVWGYVHWSALDNFEWMHGYGPTFGLIGVDRATFARQVRDSARWLGDFAQAHPDGP